jgi:hypothetical protein
VKPKRAGAKPRSRKVSVPQPAKFVFNAAHRKMAITGLMRVIMAMQEVIRPRIVTDSWIRTGLYKFSIDQMIYMCKTRIPKGQVEILKAAVPAAALLFGTQGELFEGDIEATGLLPTRVRKTCIDKLVPYRRRSIDITNDSFTVRELLRNPTYTAEDDERQDNDAETDFVVTAAVVKPVVAAIKLRRVRAPSQKGKGK